MKNSPFKRIISSMIMVAFAFTMIMPPSNWAQSLPGAPGTAISPTTINGLNLPLPGVMISTSMKYTPVIVTGITIFPEDPLQFDFIINSGDDHFQGEDLKKEAKKLINYLMGDLLLK